MNRVIAIKIKSSNIEECEAFLRVLMRHVDDRIRHATGAPPLLSDIETQEIKDILTDKKQDPNHVSALKKSGISLD